MATNDFVPFCSTNTGSNLLSQAAYLADAQLPIGNQPGVARSVLVNKALRQATYIASCLAQFISNKTGDDVLDDNTSSEVLTTLGKAFKTAPTVQEFSSGSGTYTLPANVLYLRVRMIGGGGGGGGSGSVGGANGTAGGTSAFGASLLVAGGGAGGGAGGAIAGAGGSASLGSGPVGLAAVGSAGQASSLSNPAGVYISGANGASGVWGGGGQGTTTIGGDATGVGSGGAGAGTLGNATVITGGAGGSGGYVDAIIYTPSATYAYVVGAAGAFGTQGTAGAAGGAGFAGKIIVEEYYQ